MWQPGVGPSYGDISAQIASLNARLKEVGKEVVWLNAIVWDLTKQVDTLTRQSPPSPFHPK